MAKTILSIVQTAYRATIEEQDDAAVWFSAAVKNAGGDLTLLLCGQAIHYAVEGQDASGLSIGGPAPCRPPRLDHDLTQLIANGVAIYLIEDDVTERDLPKPRLIPGVRFVSRLDLPELLDRFDFVWHW